MSNYNYVCFDCQKARRVDPRAKTGPVLCTICKNEMICIGIKLRIPEKADKKGWEELKNIIISSVKDNSLKRHISRLRRIPREALNRDIRATYGLKNESALRKRKKLRAKLSKINGRTPNQ
jgi:hypothetical protein